jgi:hypothetical protein
MTIRLRVSSVAHSLDWFEDAVTQILVGNDELDTSTHSVSIGAVTFLGPPSPGNYVAMVLYGVISIQRDEHKYEQIKSEKDYVRK